MRMIASWFGSRGGSTEYKVVATMIATTGRLASDRFVSCREGGRVAALAQRRSNNSSRWVFEASANLPQWTRRVNWVFVVGRVRSAVHINQTGASGKRSV